MDEQQQGFINQLEQDNRLQRVKNIDLSHALASSQFMNQNKSLIEWQIETEKFIERLENFLKGAVFVIDSKGARWEMPKDKSQCLLNEYGVNSIMQIIGNYVNKENILSFYSEERIYEILGDIGDKLNDFIFCNYEKMGMDTEFKRSRHQLLVLNILHIIESSYRRALLGKEREEINTGRIVTQNLNDGMRMAKNPTQPKFSVFRPSTW